MEVLATGGGSAIVPCDAAFGLGSDKPSLALFQAQVCLFRLALGDVDERGGLAPSELLSLLESAVLYVGGGAVAVRSIPSPPFGYVRVLGMSPPDGSVTPISTSYKCQSIFLCNATSTYTMRHNL